MNQTPQLTVEPAKSKEEIALLLLLLSLALIFLGPFVVFGSVGLWHLMRQQLGTKPWRILLVAGVSSAIIMVLNWPQVGSLFLQLRQTPSSAVLLSLWIVLLPLVPFGVVLMEAWDKLKKLLRPQTLEEQLKAEEAWLMQQGRKASQHALGQAQQPPQAKPGELHLGPYIRGDVFPASLGIGRNGRWLTLDERLLDQHLFLCGAPGAGKSETIKRLVAEVLQKTERDVFVVDGKGDSELADTIRALVWQHKGIDTPIFRLGHEKRGAVYHGFQGQPEAIYSRLAAMVGVGEATGDARIFDDVNRDILQLAAYAPSGPPRSFEEVLDRLNFAWLRHAYRGIPKELEAIESYAHARRDFLTGLLIRMRPLVREFMPLVGPEGFCLEETRNAIFSIRTQSVSDTASRFLQFLIEDLKDFIGKRQQRPALLVIDEYGAFGTKNVIKPLSLARSAKLGIVLATQDVADLGDRETKERILSNTRTKLLMASEFPEDIATLAGTIYQIEASMQHQEGEATGLGSARIQHAFKIDPNEAGRLEPGEAFLIRARYAAKLRISRIGDVKPAPPEQPSGRSIPPQSSPPPPPANEPPAASPQPPDEETGVDP